MNMKKKKYIIELEEDQYTIRLLKIKNGEKWPQCDFMAVTPYTEPDLDAIRKEAYDKGYKDATAKISSDEQAIAEKAYHSGLNDAWAAAKNLQEIDMYTIHEIFGWVAGKRDVFIRYTATEVIEKLKAYEQKQEETQVGDEVECDDERYVVLQKYLNSIDELMVVLFNRRNGEINKWHLYNADGVIFKKTGRHFPELVELLRKMKEEQP